MKTGVRYQILPSVLLGFHGTDKKTAANVLAGRTPLEFSENDYDWLGHGTYFWEHSPQRAFQFAQEKKRRGEIKSIAVIGAVIDPGLCLNLLEAVALEELKAAYEVLKVAVDPLPKNVGGSDFRLRHLDCAVIEIAHELRKKAKARGRRSLVLPPYDTVRAVFTEGNELYSGAGFKEKTHVQICVRNPEKVKGYFKVITE